mmetsp:Transcript_18021/g.25182  ORF Transcript_18021/g.25182 Transcript_18021/m.25182 type:complete len:578 (-) Transcript_18021:115-1848(-)
MMLPGLQRTYSGNQHGGHSNEYSWFEINQRLQQESNVLKMQLLEADKQMLEMRELHRKTHELWQDALKDYELAQQVISKMDDMIAYLIDQVPQPNRDIATNTVSKMRDDIKTLLDNHKAYKMERDKVLAQQYGMIPHSMNIMMNTPLIPLHKNDSTADIEEELSKHQLRNNGGMNSDSEDNLPSNNSSGNVALSASNSMISNINLTGGNPNMGIPMNMMGNALMRNASAEIKTEDSQPDQSPPTPSSPQSGKKKGVKRPASPQNTGGELSAAGIPRSAKLVSTVVHGDVVCSVLISNNNNRLYTGSKGGVKLWEINPLSSQKSKYELKCIDNGYVRALKMTPNGKYLIAGGESSKIALFDCATQNVPVLSNQVMSSSPATYGIAMNYDDNDNHSFYSCHSDGKIYAWDLHTMKIVRTFNGHVDGVTKVEVSPDGSKLISSGLDGMLKVWDIAQGKELSSYAFGAQIYCMEICPGDSWVAVGLENSVVEVCNLTNTNCKYQMHLHESSILSLKFAHSGKWFATTGKDRMVNTWRSPFGGAIFQCKEPNSVLCCDISQDDSMMATGSGERLASVYEIVY